VSGYCIDTVAAALWTWAANRGDARAAIEAAVRLGGDTDSVAAITGGLAGADGGVGALPAGWLARLSDWPLDRRHLEQLAAALSGAPLPADRTLLALPRNLAAAVIFGLHAMRRLTW
jgi:ADP-ribosyl-[dinitrogen reductase] hydrolase